MAGEKCLFCYCNKFKKETFSVFFILCAIIITLNPTYLISIWDHDKIIRKLVRIQDKSERGRTIDLLSLLSEAREFSEHKGLKLSTTEDVAMRIGKF